MHVSCAYSMYLDIENFELDHVTLKYDFVLSYSSLRGGITFGHTSFTFGRISFTPHIFI